MDIARGLAILAVVAIHVSGGPLTDSTSGGLVTLFYMTVNVAARFAVPVFVLLSGLGLSLSDKGNEGYFTFLKRRLAKLLPAYAAWTLIYTLVARDSLKRVPVYLLTGDACYHLYFVPLIVMLYLLYPIIKRALSTRAGLVASGIITITAVCVNRYGGVPEWANVFFDYRSPLNWMFYLAVGCSLAKPGVMDSLSSPKYRHLATVAFLGCLAGMVAFVRVSTSQGSDIETALQKLGPSIVIYTMLFVAFVWKQPWDQWRAACVLKWFSKYSYGIYLSHVLVLLAVGKLCNQINADSYGPIYVASLFAVVAFGSALLTLGFTRIRRLAIN